MDSGIPYGDIIVLGAIAAFIILRYRAMLGEKSGRDAADLRAAPLEEYERIIQLPGRDAPIVPAKPAVPAKDYGALNDTFAAIARIDREFTPEEFMNGARGAYEMVIEAYNKSDDETLKLLLSTPIYNNFKSQLREDAAQGRKHTTTLVVIARAEMTDARLRGNTAQITVDFHSEQVNLVRDRDDAIIEGDPSHQAAVEDRWVFERNLGNTDPNWKVIET